MSGYSKFGRGDASAEEMCVGNFLFAFFAYKRSLSGFAFESIDVHSPGHLKGVPAGAVRGTGVRVYAMVYPVCSCFGE